MDPILMSTAAGAAHAGASKLLDVAKVAMQPGGVADVVNNVSLTRYLRNTMLTSRIYIDGTIGHDAIIPDVVRSAHTLYVSLILNALQLDRLVSKTTPVKELLKAVATEHATSEHIDTTEAFSLHCGIESDMPAPRKFKRPPPPKPSEVVGARTVEQDKSGFIPVGRMVEIEFTNPEVVGAANIKVNLLVQMFPYLIGSELVPEFIKLNATPGVLKRFTMWKAGEISFWKDFIFSTDVFRQKKAILKNDKDGVLAAYLRDQAKKDVNNVYQVYEALAQGGQHANPNRNIANTVMVLSEEQVVRAKADTGFDLRDAADRNKFFAQTYTMLIYIVDPMYNTVKLYMNGISAVGTYTFDMFKPKGKSNDVVNLLEAVSAMSQGKAPRF